MKQYYKFDFTTDIAHSINKNKLKKKKIVIINLDGESAKLLVLFSSTTLFRHDQLLTLMDHMLHMDKFSEIGFQAEYVKFSQVFLSSLTYKIFCI